MGEAATSDTIRKAYPAAWRLALAWLLVGPLPPMQLVWIIGFRLNGESPPAAVFWLIGLPAALTAALCLPALASQETRSRASLFRLGLNAWLLTSIAAVLAATLIASPLGVQAAIATFLTGLLTATIAGAPAALLAVLIVRLIVFRSVPGRVSAPLSTP